jgi:hypothetical protein
MLAPVTRLAECHQQLRLDELDATEANRLEVVGIAASSPHHSHRPFARGTARQRIVSGVPIFISRASLRMSALRIRMHPCEMWPGRSSG